MMHYLWIFFDALNVSGVEDVRSNKGELLKSKHVTVLNSGVVHRINSTRDCVCLIQDLKEVTCKIVAP